jgi:hypothetical protein
MATAAIQLPERLRFLHVFLALWVLSYLGPHLLAAVADLFLQIARFAGSETAADIGAWVVWVGLLPTTYAWAQWLLMRLSLASCPAPTCSCPCSWRSRAWSAPLWRWSR